MAPVMLRIKKYRSSPQRITPQKSSNCIQIKALRKAWQTEMEANRTLHLISKEQTKLSISESTAIKFSELIKQIQVDSSEDTIQLANFTRAQIQQVIDFMQYHDNMPYNFIEKPIKGKKIDQLVCDWDCKYVIKQSDADILKLLEIAQYLQCTQIIDLICGYIASLYQNKSIKDIQNEYGVSDQLTEQLEKELIEQNQTLFQGLKFEIQLNDQSDQKMMQK